MYMLMLKRRGLLLRNLIQMKRLRSDFFKNRSRFFKIIFWRFFSWIFVQAIILFHDYLHLCVILEAYSSEIWCRDTKVRFCGDLEEIFSKVVLDYRDNIYLSYKSRKNRSIVTKFEYVFAMNNVSLYIKNHDRILDYFYRDASKRWIFIWIIKSVKTDQLSRHLDMFLL